MTLSVKPCVCLQWISVKCSTALIINFGLRSSRIYPFLRIVNSALFIIVFKDNGQHPFLFKCADDSSLIVPVWSNGQFRKDLDYSLICNPSNCKEIILRKKGFIQDIAQVNNIPQCTKLAILEEADKKIFKLRSVDPDCPLSNIIPKKKETKYQLRNKSAH
ncbi:hypothetical protein pdam_00007374, partial [Pocillopora damicornis]